MGDFGDVRSACHARDLRAVRDELAGYMGEDWREVAQYVKGALGFLPPSVMGWVLTKSNVEMVGQPTPQDLLGKASKLPGRSAYTLVSADWYSHIGMDGVLLVKRFDDLHHALVVAVMPLLEELVASFKGTGASDEIKAAARADMARCLELHRTFAAEPTKRHKGALSEYRYLGAWQDSGSLFAGIIIKVARRNAVFGIHEMPDPRSQPRKYSAALALISPARASFDAWDIALDVPSGTSERRICANLLIGGR
jgi:hypothetical protein